VRGFRAFREVVRTSRKPTKAGGARAFQPKGRYKRLDKVVDAMPELLRRFPNLKYMIVGDGDDRSRLEEKVKSLGLSEQIIFAGKISKRETASRMHSRVRAKPS
jgi:glycosyltransferase involved in cell wall biosynthesis